MMDKKEAVENLQNLYIFTRDTNGLVHGYMKALEIPQNDGHIFLRNAVFDSVKTIVGGSNYEKWRKENGINTTIDRTHVTNYIVFSQGDIQTLLDDAGLQFPGAKNRKQSFVDKI